jgi:hypothetical protein
MQDNPQPKDIVPVVAAMLRETILPQLEGRATFDLRVAINALELVSRQLAHADEANAAEHTRLRDLLNQNGDLLALNRALSRAIETGTITLDDPKLQAHLWATTMDKLKIDQPNYASYVAELKANS